jgi:anti-sigma factor RsiW
MMNASHRIGQQLSAYLDGELTADEMAEVRQHLEGCPACRADIEELQRMKRLLARLQPPEVPRTFEAELLARIDRRSLMGWLQWPRPAMALAAVALAVILVAVPLVRDHRDRLRASEVGPDVFIRTAAQSSADDPFMDRAYIGLVATDANLRLAGEDPRGQTR